MQLLKYCFSILVVAGTVSSFTTTLSPPSNHHHDAGRIQSSSSLPLPMETSFSVPPPQQRRRRRRLSSSPLFMGRAAAVRAATKGKADAQKAKTNGMFGKKIIMAVKQGGSPDPNANRMLADVIKQAKTNNVPVDNINRAIRRASEASTGDFSEATYEAYGAGGASFVVNVLTDNNNRAAADVRSTVGKRSGKMAESGSVLFSYDRKARIEVVDVQSLDEDAVLEAAIAAGCDDYEIFPAAGEGASTVVSTDPKDATAMMDAIHSLGHDNLKLSLAWVSKAPVLCTDEEFEKNMGIVDALEELDDVDSVEHNMSN